MLKKIIFILLLFVAPHLSAMESNLTVLERKINTAIGYQPGSEKLHPKTPIFDIMKQAKLTEKDLECIKKTDTFVTLIYFLLFIETLKTTYPDFCTSQHSLLKQEVEDYHQQAPEKMATAALFIAAARNLLTVIQYIIKTRNINPTQLRDQFNQTLLRVAINNNSFSVIEFLLQHYQWSK